MSGRQRNMMHFMVCRHNICKPKQPKHKPPARQPDAMDFTHDYQPTITPKHLKLH